MKPLPVSFYARDTQLVARELLGKLLVRRINNSLLSGRIVEVEAYYGLDDPASHSFRGRTPRCAVMWGRPGLAYVYFSYGMHYLLNVVTEKVGVAGAVLIRSLQPLEGIPVMQRNRKREKITDLSSGPAKLTEALVVTAEFNGHDLASEELYITADGDHLNEFRVVQSGRIGISRGVESQLRFFIDGSPFVSRGHVHTRRQRGKKQKRKNG